MTYAIILAAGLGHRFKETPIKPLFPIKGKPLFLHSLNVFLSCKNIETIILVINKEHRVSYLKYIDKLKSKNCYLTFGDPKQRYKSLMNAMMYVQKNFSLQPNDIILTHDAARINVTPKIIKQSILVAQKYGYASTVLPIHDSIGEIIKTVKYLDRHNKYLIQTPQTIQYKYWKNIKVKSSNKVTDLFTYLKLNVSQQHLVTGSLSNFKITTVDDLKLI